MMTRKIDTVLFNFHKGFQPINVHFGGLIIYDITIFYEVRRQGSALGMKFGF